MKNIFWIGLFLFLSTTGCKDYLDEENKSNILADEYYRTATGYEALVNSSYSSLREVYMEPWIFLAGTDMFVAGRNAQPEGLSEYRNLATTDPEVTKFYAATYKAIQRCNTAIYFNDKTESTSTLPNRLGEMKFLRAYYYFLLVQNFGGVSIVQDFYKSAPTKPFNRNTASEVYDFIIKEMDEALTLIPNTQLPASGRVSAPAIKHFLAKVYLTRGYESFGSSEDFVKAAALADEAINGKKLTISFNDLFAPGKEKNDEVLFAIQFDKTSMKNLMSDGTNQNLYFGPYLGGEGAKNGYPYRSYTLIPTMYAYNLFTANDARWEGTFMNVMYSRYYDFYDKPVADRSKLNIAFYYPQSWEAAGAEEWRKGGGTTVLPERKATRIIPYGVGWEGIPGAGLDNGTPAVRKFDDPTSQFSANGSSTRDIFLARLGETYLIAAEAYLKLNNLGKAVERVNEVRKRAAKSGKDLSVSSVDIDFILDERGRELLGEYDRWFDLKRTGKLVERTSLYNRDIKTKYPGGAAFIGQDGNNKILRPIPQAAIDLNQGSDFTQNPGY